MAGRKVLPDGHSIRKNNRARGANERTRISVGERKGDGMGKNENSSRGSRASSATHLRDRRRTARRNAWPNPHSIDSLSRARFSALRRRRQHHARDGARMHDARMHARVHASPRWSRIAEIARARHPREYSPPQYFVTSTSRPSHRPYLHPRRSVAESAAIFYTREHILHCDVGRFASLRKAQAARASAILVEVAWEGDKSSWVFDSCEREGRPMTPGASEIIELGREVQDRPEEFFRLVVVALSDLVTRVNEKRRIHLRCHAMNNHAWLLNLLCGISRNDECEMNFQECNLHWSRYSLQGYSLSLITAVFRTVPCIAFKIPLVTNISFSSASRDHHIRVRIVECDWEQTWTLCLKKV